MNAFKKIVWEQIRNADAFDRICYYVQKELHQNNAACEKTILLARNYCTFGPVVRAK